MAEWERFHITHASMGHMSEQQAYKAYASALEREPDIATFTESHAADKMRALTKACRKYDYTVIDWRGSSAGAVRTGKKYDMYFKGKKSTMAHKPKHEGLLAGYVNEAKLKWHGHDITMHTGHWPSRAYENREIHQRMTRMMGMEFQRNARRKAISFCTGDLNADPDDWFYPGAIFFDYKMKTWQKDASEIGTLNTRGGRSIDIICRYGGDDNVKFVKRVVHPKTASDHIPVSAWYDIRSKQQYVDNVELMPLPVYQAAEQQDLVDQAAVEAETTDG